MKKIKSLRTKLFFTLSIVIIMVIAFFIIVNNVVLETIFYYSKKENSLNTYKFINENITNVLEENEKEKFELELEKIAINNSFDILILNKDEEIFATNKNFISNFSDIKDIKYEVNYSIFNKSDIMYVKDNSMNYSNIVSLTNNLKAVTVGYNSATIHWTTVDPKEPVKFQVSTDGGSTWFIKVYNIDKKQSTATLRNLDFDTEYQIKLLFPERYTGKNSNILTFKTEKHPIEKITLSSLNSLDSLHLKFNTGKTFSNIELELVEIYGNVKTTIPYTNMDNLTKKNINASTVCIEGDITGLKKGTYYSVRAHALGSKYGYSSYSKSANTIGDNPQGFSVASVGQHEVELKWNALDRIPTGDTREFVMITYTKDNVLYDSVTVPIINTPFRIDDLEQDTTYKFKMFCYYGDNYGESSEVTVTTGADIYPALNGERLNDETCMAYSSVDDNFYIFDKGILYSYNKTTKAQAIVKDYNLKTNHAYGDIKTDKNGKVHLLFTADKCVQQRYEHRYIRRISV